MNENMLITLTLRQTTPDFELKSYLLSYGTGEHDRSHLKITYCELVKRRVICVHEILIDQVLKIALLYGNEQLFL